MNPKEEMTDVANLLAKVPTDLFIGGQWRASSTNKTFAVENPSTGTELVQLADASTEDGLAAIDSAAAAQDSWASTAPRFRAELLRAVFDNVIERKEEFATLMTLEMGKAFDEALAEVNYAAEFLRWFSEQTNRVSGSYQTAPDGKNRLLVLKRPVGPSLLITPWNFPLAMATRKIAPAIAAGCTMVVKPAALTPLSTMLFAKTLDDLGLPDGVLNVIPTSKAGAVTGPIIDDPRLRKISFTGSTEVGVRLMEQSAKRVLRTSMELGGNAPLLVFNDADLEQAVNGAMAAKFRNIGQACTAANRLYVQSGIYDQFVAKLAERIGAMKTGDGLANPSGVGPLVDSNARDSVHALVTSAVADGAKVVIGGQIPEGPGYFYPPTLIEGAKATSEITTSEIFGPVASVTKFETDEDGIRLANSSEYGLVSYVFTKDLDRALRMSERIEVGMMGINTGIISNPAAPFGGVKASGVGREGGTQGIEEYLETVYVGISDPVATA
jgi:succinate-semialdehyde dehydrogenase/glutarate-semialdehyde dehydrogenase